MLLPKLFLCSPFFDSADPSLITDEAQTFLLEDKIDHELVDHQVICGVCPPRTRF